jgi:hypothetical protein
MRRTIVVLGLLLLALAVYVLHQDFWNWTRYRPLVFGFLPIGLAYHAAYSVLAAIMMAIFVKLAWPTSLEKTPSPPEDQSGREDER